MPKITDQTTEVIEISIEQEATILLAICKKVLSNGNILMLHEIEPHLKRFEDLKLTLLKNK